MSALIAEYIEASWERCDAGSKAMNQLENLADEGRAAIARSRASASVQNHSNDSAKNGGATLVPTTSSHRRRPVPMADMDPGLRREDDRRGAGVDLLN